MAVIASLVVDLEARTARLERDLARAQRSNRNFTRQIQRNYRQLSGTLRNVGAAAAAAIAVLAGGSVAQITNAADEIAKQARNVGFATEAYQRWQTALSLAGIEQRSFVTAATQVTRAIGEANNGLASYQRAFEQLGLDYRSLANQTPEQQFEAVLRALEGTENATVRASAGAILLGRAWRQVGSVIDAGVDETLNSVTGLTPITDMAAMAAERFNDAWEFAITEIRNRLINQLAPALEFIADNISRTVDFTIAGANAISIAWNVVTATIRTLIAGFNEFLQIFLRGLRLIGLEVDEYIARNEAFEASLGAAVGRDLEQIQEQWKVLNEAIQGTTASAEEFRDVSTGGGSDLSDSSARITESLMEAAGEAPVLFQGLTEELERWEGFTNNVIDNLTRSFTDFFRTGEFNARQFADNIISEFIRIQIRTAITGLFGAPFGGFRQAGGPVQSGQAYIVGEAGPELFVPNANGAIIPNGGGGGGSTTNIYEINAVDAASFQTLVARDPEFIAGVVARGQRSGGLR